MDTEPTAEFEQSFPVSRCWKCQRDMAYCARHEAWECSCGFVLHEDFCQVTHANFECLVLLEDIGLAKLRDRRGFASIRIENSHRG